MRNRPELVTLTAVAVCLAVLALVGLTSGNDRAFTLGVIPAAAVAPLERGDRACQERIDASEDFSRVELQIGTYRRPGTPLELTVHEADGSGEVLGRGRLAGGYPDVSRPRIPVGTIEGDRQLAVCIEPVGRGRVALYGNAGIASPASELEINGRPLDADVTLVFHHAEERSRLAEMPDSFERAALFKAGWVGPWVFWLLLVAALVAVPLALARAVRSVRSR
jgi:hypothetical protein